MAPQAAKALKTKNYSSTIADCRFAQQVTIKTMHSEYRMTPQKSRFHSDMPPASEEGGELCADGDGWCGQPGKGFLLEMIVFSIFSLVCGHIYFHWFVSILCSQPWKSINITVTTTSSTTLLFIITDIQHQVAIVSTVNLGQH